MDGKMECPICKKRVLFVGVHDDEGNYHGPVGCEYENDPWSGLSYALHHEGWGDCPLCTDGAYSAMGGMLFDTSEEAISALTLPNEWVSVDERLPKAEKEVRLFCITSNGYKYQCQGFYVPPGMHRDDSDYSWDWECCEQYDEDSGDYFVNPGWYESCHNWDEYSAFRVADKVTHWMPLPEPPTKEE